MNANYFQSNFLCSNGNNGHESISAYLRYLRSPERKLENEMVNPKTISRWILIVICGCFILCLSASGQDLDTDGDGLSDFHETYKYFTDPMDKDTDGDGTHDGDWLERREYQYSVRSIVQVMKPVTIEFLNDDYQDARLLDETDSYAELEVIHYPFNNVASSLTADKNWRDTIQNSSLDLAKWLKPGPTADWTPKLQKEILDALKKDGIKLEPLSDQQVVQKVSKWLLKRAKFEDGFSCFSTAFDAQGRPYIPEDLKEHVGKGSDLTPELQWEREVSAAGMFRNKMRGSCSSSAIYLNGCLRAVGVPTRTILCIPIVDASDDSEVEMIRRLKQSGVRQQLLAAILPLKGSWASHTYNEVYVGGRWRRLNYDRLGQNTFDPGLFGLMTHVATFHDWADARMHETIGRRQTIGTGDLFGGPNPYSTISLRDEIGVHCEVDLPDAEVETVTVERIRWTDSPDLPEEIRDNCERRGRFGLIADVTGFRDQDSVRNFLAQADLRVYMDVADSGSEGQSDDANEKRPMRLGVGFDAGCYWLSNNLLRIYVPFGKGDQRDLVTGVTYRFRPRNDNQDYRWRIPADLTVVRENE